MSLRNGPGNPVGGLRRSFDRHPLARELTAAVLAVGGFALLYETLRDPLWAVVRLLPAAGDPAVAMVVEGGLTTLALLTVMIGAALAYCTVREVPVALDFPDAGDLPILGAAVAVPPLLVLAADAVADAAGSSLSAVTGHYVASDAALAPYAVIVVLSLFLVVSTFLLVAYVVVQSSLRRVTNGRVAVGLTTVVVGTSVLWDPAGLLSLSAVIAAALFAPAIAVAVLARDRLGQRPLRYLGYAPLGALIVLVPVDFLVLDPAGAGEVAVALAEVGAIGLGAYGYERTDSLAVPALALSAFYLTGDAVVFLFEAGVTP